MNKEFEEYKKEVAETGHQGDGVELDMWFSHHAAVELAEQKALLCKVMTVAGEDGGMLEGILNTIDVIQDQLHDIYGYPTDIVFPFEKKFKDFEPEVINYKQALGILLEKMPQEELPKYMNLDPELTKAIQKLFKGDEI